MAAMVAIKHQNCLKAPLHDFLQTAGPCNQKELIGILRAVCLLRPSASAAQLQLALDCMRYTIKNKLDTKFPAEVTTMLAVWDEALLCGLRSFKKLNESPAAWWKNYKDPAYQYNGFS